eukprot:6473977-Amphidinium_carterae.1
MSHCASSHATEASAWTLEDLAHVFFGVFLGVLIERGGCDISHFSHPEVSYVGIRAGTGLALLGALSATLTKAPNQRCNFCKSGRKWWQ